MADDLKVYYPEEIADAPFPGQAEANFGVSQPGSGGLLSSAKTKEQVFPSKRIAVELLSSALNTRSKKILQEISFTESGALRIGKYENGVSGDIRLTPAGIVMRDKAGVITVAQYAEDGSAVFKGSIQAGSLISGLVVVGNNAWIIDGDADRPRILCYNDNIPEILIGEP